MRALHFSHEQPTKLLSLPTFSGRAHLSTHALHCYVQEDWPIAPKKMKLWRLLKIEGFILIYVVPPLGPKENICQSTWVRSEVLIRRTCWGTHCELGEHFGNPLGT
jgi:hypothetical protein